MKKRFHECSTIFPVLAKAELKALAKDIKANGLQQPIVMYQGKILDGRNRYIACKSIGVRPKFETYHGNEPLAYVISLNLHRRHLTESQRALVASNIANMPKGVNQHTPIGVSTQADAAKAMNVSVNSVQRAAVVRDKGSAALIKAVETGKMSVSLASEIATKPKQEQQRIISLGSDDLIIKAANKIKTQRKKIKQVAKEKTQQKIPPDLPKVTNRYKLIHSDIRKADIKSNSIDCIVTDPPYPQEFIKTFDWLAERASHWLKPGGSMLVMSGQSWLPKVLNSLDAHSLNYHWTLAYLTPGGQSVQIFPRKVNTFWKPVFWFVKGEYKGDWIGDVTKSNPNDNDKRFHYWGQSESGMADLIKRISLPGQTILDPFCGGGTTGVVAVQLNRLFIGIDSDEKAIRTSTMRLKGVASEK